MTAIEKELRRKVHSLADETLQAEPACAYAGQLLLNAAIDPAGKTLCFNCFEILVSKPSDPLRTDAKNECAACGAPVN